MSIFLREGITLEYNVDRASVQKCVNTLCQTYVVSIDGSDKEEVPYCRCAIKEIACHQHQYTTKCKSRE